MPPARDDLSKPIHLPVMVHEVLRHLLGGLDDETGGLVVDGTVGLGGHAAAILEARPAVRLLGLDRDPEALAFAAKRLERFGERVRLVHDSYANLRGHVAQEAPRGILLDVGASSLQLDDAERGFSFARGREGADMRFDRTSDEPTALDLVNGSSEKELARILHEYGDEPRSRAVARRLVEARPFRTGAELAAVVRGAAFRTRRIDAATRTFQALRIATNDELGHLERGLEAAIDVLDEGGRLVVLSFHSGEDRRVKNAFRDAARAGRGVVRTKKPERATDEEVRQNRRARSTRLRAFERRTKEEVEA